jgi:hypothetical protein
MSAGMLRAPEICPITSGFRIAGSSTGSRRIVRTLSPGMPISEPI